MQENENWVSQYYSESAQDKLKTRQKLWSPELQAQVSQQWLELIADVQKALDKGEDPASSRGQELGQRWKELVRGFTGDDPEIRQGLFRMWGDKGNWPAAVEKDAKAFHITPEMFAFVQQSWNAKKEE